MKKLAIAQPKGVTPKTFSELYPRLYHMAHEDAWEQIQRHGLLSTSSLLNLWEVTGKQRSAVEGEVRRNEVELRHPRRGKVVIRDQKPLYERKLRKALIDCTVQQWCQLLNRRVFFWPTVERLVTHISARGNRGKNHLVLTIDSYRLAAAYEKTITLCPLNSGNTIPFAQERGKASLMRMSEYPFLERLARGPYYTVVELAVETGVPDILDFVVSADYMTSAGRNIKQISRIKF
jgi:Family of unknown function (DUF7002)